MVLVYPLGSNDWTTFFQGGKAVYVQLYSSQEALKNDTTSPPACTGNETVGTSTPITCVQGNGSVTSKGGYTGGGSGGIAALINEIFGIIIGFLQELVYGIFYWLIAPLIQAMLSIHVYTDTFVAVIYPGWEVIRNICNIFFIIALIVIALATLFRVESYQARGLLVQLILAALMINFSLVIAQAILALADTVQAQFLPANVTVIRSLAGDLMVGTYRDLYITKAFSDASFSGIIKPLFFLAMSIGSFAVFTAIAVFLLIRVVAIWLLLLISPLAYALGVLPSTAQYKKTWWDNFLKYAFFTPIMAFFLNMTAVISNQFKDNTILQTVSDPRLVQDLGNSDVAAFVFRVASNLLLLVFLIAALKVADMAGVYGASAITSTAQKGIFAPFAIVGGATKAGVGMAKDYGSRKKVEYTTKWFGKNLKDEHGEIGAKGRAKQALFAMFNPSIVKKSLEERKERKEHEVGHEASAVAEEITASLPWIDEPDLARRAETVLHLAKEKGEKETPYLSERQAIGVVKQIYAKMLKGKKDNTTKLQYLGALDQLMGEKGMNEILVSGVTGKKYEISRKGAIQWINDQVASGIIDEDEAGHLAAAMSKHAYENKEFWYAEIYNMDHHGHPKRIHSSIDKDTGEVIVEGESDYKSLTNDLENKFESFVQAKASETPEGTTPENLAKLRKKHRSDFEKEFWEKAEHANPDKYHKYENYKAFENSKLEAYTNFTKLGARDKIGFAHWSLVADIMTNGEYKMSDITGRHILDANEKNDYSQASHMNAKKNNALQRFIEDAGGVEKAYETYKDALEGVAIDREMQKRRDKGFAATPEIREQIKKSLDTDEEVEIGGIKANYHKQIRDDIKVRFQKYDESMVHFKPVSPGDKPPKS
ncbi:MAG: type IV secretion system protein [Candidatus Shapirobacteria bacterium]|nr:type IV secretion system protein [Candidatus Shapirobacteria bacterium]